MTKLLRPTGILILIVLFNACATYKAQYAEKKSVSPFPTEKTIKHTFYLIGDAGNSPLGDKAIALKMMEKELQKASKNSTAIFLGDNIYPAGLPKKSSILREFAAHQLDAQTSIVKDFKGRTIFIPGNHDWYSDGLEGLKRQEKYIEDIVGKNTFLPEDGCPIEKIHVSEDIELILLDTQWYITNWDRHPTINDDCEIKTRTKFLEEYSSLIKKARGKTTIVALHHPMYTNGPHNAQYTFKTHLTPIPILGSLKNLIRSTSGTANVDQSHKRYNELRKRIITLSQENDKVIFVSGHEHSLQYITEDNLRQIVSGSGAKKSGTRNVGGGKFSYGTHGFARLDVFTDGSSFVRFYSAEDNELVFETEVIREDAPEIETIYPETFPKHVYASVYTKEETEKSGFHKFLWGDRYRELFSTPVKAPTVDLDTLYGGLEPVRKGGGNQSKSLRLRDKNGAEYVMRALRKQALQYLQAVLFKEQYVKNQFEDTSTQDLILDIFTGAHPYAPFAVGRLADGAQVYHTNPILFYVPKQKALGKYNVDFGDELYMIEEHTSEGHSDKASFGYQDDLESTDDFMKKLHKDEDIIIDEASYIRARLFDMLIGDWDRHQDQWRWIEFRENGQRVFRPLPRDRDQAFSKMSDGFLLGTAVKIIPTARLLRKYEEDLEDVKGVNIEPYPLDMEIIQQSGKEVWDAQVKIIQEGVTDEVIEEAFLAFPEEVRDETLEEIKEKLKGRRKNLQAISDRYYELINKLAVIKGTNKDDWFDIERLPNGKTKVTAYRIKGGEKKDIFHERTYDEDETKEIWIYALDDDDVFHVYGKGDDYIKVRLVGGQNNDVYDIKNGKKIIYYDYKSKKNTFLSNKGNRVLTDNYETNVYDYKKLKNGTSQLLPTLGFNPDDGIKIGVSTTITDFGFERNPFTSRHTIRAEYFFATNGFDLGYLGEFSNIIGRWNLLLGVDFNSPNYAINFFGFGNNTPNPEADENDGLDVDLDFNRVKIRTFTFTPSLIWRGQLGGNFQAGFSYESNEIERTPGRFLEQNFPADSRLFDKQDFFGVRAKYHYKNVDNAAFPTMGMEISVESGYKNNVSTTRGFAYLIPEFAINHRLISSGQLVLATKFRGHINFGDGFEFYQAASLGARTGLRGFRHERFTGKRAFVQTTDLRVNLRKVKTGILPLNIGVFGGFDYGRIWISGDTSEKWNTSLGGGIWLNAADMLSANISLFNSDDGLRFAFGFGFGF
ncbi:calcineurin-like phosphoesterase family protein [Kordia periserrulae]|uniref:Calcineurin-like phosphoesterase family protein n=1 Tax=Kordia periserrulae TaxID=701523 RepID=A0A2T6C6L2_9FLAO|nr:metallophosphoesterase [Kordia periserrulae]PTX63959.1 calcineurin-like phosphoesterase family protein [Kordia periserrulae]